MLKKEEKDKIIEFLRNNLMKIKEIADFDSEYYETDDCDYYSSGPCNEFMKIADIAEKTLNDTTW